LAVASYWRRQGCCTISGQRTPVEGRKVTVPHVQSFYHAPTNTWTHVVADPDSKAAAIIDPVLDFDPASGRAWPEHAKIVLAWIRERELRVDWILETHAHADHLTAADWLKRQLLSDTNSAPTGPLLRTGPSTKLRTGPSTTLRTGPSTTLRTGPSTKLRTGIGAGIIAVQRHFRDVFALDPEFSADGSQFDHLFSADESFSIGELDGCAIATPGHTSDGVSYLIGDAVFVGDTLFAPGGGTGRCDFPGADATLQYRSIKRLYELPDVTRVFLCHDYPAAGVEAVAETSIAAQKAGNTQLRAETSEAEYVAFRARRDATLAAPRLLYPSLQVNIRAGRLPDADAAGRIFLRLPVRAEY
jgi:glyoxylase-like metal-dependent hydrolase (beta-lactamase superfamily II)